MTESHKLILVPVESVHQFLPLVRWYVESALSNTDLTFEQVRVYLSSGAWNLILCFDEKKEIQAAVVLCLVNEPNDRTATIVTTGGSPGVITRGNFEQLCEIAKSLGATKIQALSTRKGARLFRRVGLVERSVVLEKKLWVA